MIYISSKKKEEPDICFYASRESSSTKINRISFNGKETKDPVSSILEIKSMEIFIFSYHERYLYIMDDTMVLK